MRVILARRAKRGEQRNTAEEEIGEEKIRETFDGFTLPTVSKREGGVHFAGSVILCDPRQKRGKSASTGGALRQIAKVLMVLGSTIISSGCSARQTTRPIAGCDLVVAMPPHILFDLKPDQAIPPDSWVPWKSFDDDHPWHHTDLYRKQWEALQSPDVQRHLYRIEFGWTGEMPQLSGQTAARYWMDQSTEVEKASCPGQPVKIISEADADHGPESSP
jgi:hypothetical protein